VPDVRVGLEFGEAVGAWHAVDVQRGQGLAAFAVTAEAHVGDVDAVFAEYAAQVAHDAGAILVAHHEQDAFRDDLDRLAVEADDARMLRQPEKRSADGHLFVTGPCPDVQPFLEVHLFAGLDFLDDKPALLGHGAYVDQVDFLALGRAEESLDD